MKKDLLLWKFIAGELERNTPVMLMVVGESEGSSPGRAGFKMAISKNGQLIGSIGGGVMEVKLVELGKKMLQHSSRVAVIKRQVHSKSEPHHQSGMICSGEQTIFYVLAQQDLLTEIRQCIQLQESHQQGVLEIKFADGQSTFNVSIGRDSSQGIEFQKASETSFVYREPVGVAPHLYIIGGGHCALALSELMSKFDFIIHVLDDRPHLNTLEQNQFADFREIIKSYDMVGEALPDLPDNYVVVMSLGYRTDIQALMSLAHKSFAYLGVLGSQAKIKAIREELKNNGFPGHLLESMYAPIGIEIQSHSPDEIAVSIAAEIIRHRNRS